jgi:hypothetical protein
MDKQIYVSKFFITAPGDRSAGIFPATWEIGPDFYFDTQAEFRAFKKILLEAFEYVGDNAYIETAEEIAAEEEMDILLTEQMLDDMDNDMFDDSPRKMRDDDE